VDAFEEFLLPEFPAHSLSLTLATWQGHDTLEDSEGHVAHVQKQEMCSEFYLLGLWQNAKHIWEDIVTCISDYRQELDWRLDLLITLTTRDYN
jgi:hypothetical protein